VTLRLEATLYYNHLSDLLLPELVFECVDNESTDAFCSDTGQLPRADVDAYARAVRQARALR
jgi:hypothetical protein